MCTVYIYLFNFGEGKHMMFHVISPTMVQELCHIFFSLVYTPCLNCFGDEVVYIMLKENQTQPEIPPASTSITINIHIQAVNDPPSVFLTLNGSTLLSKDPTEEVVVSIHLYSIPPILFL